jgi:hypothetical protein
MNPELRRNLWLEFSALRLVIAPVAIGVVLLLVWLISDHSLSLVARAAEWFYLLMVLFWGIRRAADLVAEEVAGRTWDSQRMSALGAWQMTWGKFIGGISYFWYSAGLALLVRIWAQWGDGIAPLQGEAGIQNLHLLGVGLFGQAVAFLVSLVLLHKQRTRRRLGVSFSQLAGIVASVIIPGHLDLGIFSRQLPSISWYGQEYPGAEFAIATLVLFLAWTIFGAYRLMRVELQFRSIPWAWLAFGIFVMVYADGLLYRLIEEEGGGIVVWSFMPFAVAYFMTYVAVFVEPKDVIRYRAFIAALALGRLRQALQLLPLWIPVFLVAAALGLTLGWFGGFGRIGSLASFVGPGSVLLNLNAAVAAGSLPVAVVIYLLRDVLVVLFFNFGSRQGRADMLAIVCLALVYGPGAGVLATLRLSTLIAVLVPYPGAPPLITIAAPAIESAILGMLVLRRMRAAGRFRPAAA